MTLAELDNSYWFSLGLFIGGFWLVYFSFKVGIVVNIARRVLARNRRR